MYNFKITVQVYGTSTKRILSRGRPIFYDRCQA